MHERAIHKACTELAAPVVLGLGFDAVQKHCISGHRERAETQGIWTARGVA